MLRSCSLVARQTRVNFSRSWSRPACTPRCTSHFVVNVVHVGPKGSTRASWRDPRVRSSRCLDNERPSAHRCSERGNVVAERAAHSGCPRDGVADGRADERHTRGAPLGPRFDSAPSRTPKEDLGANSPEGRRLGGRRQLGDSRCAGRNEGTLRTTLNPLAFLRNLPEWVLANRGWSVDLVCWPAHGQGAPRLCKGCYTHIVGSAACVP